jgi:hypothetical protein
MKICLFGITGINSGRHHIKDPRLDQVDKLVEADKKTYVQVDLIGEDQLVDADAILVSTERRADLILMDLEFIETRLQRDPGEEERNALLKLQSSLESDQLARETELSESGRQALAAHALVTQKPVVVASAADLESPEALLVRTYHEAGYISFLTVGGKENRAWMIRKGTTAVEAAGAIHTDLQKGFIRAEIISFADLIAAGGETQAKRAGKLRLETRHYVMQDYDVVNFRFSK